MPVVRRRGRGSREALRFAAAQFADRPRAEERHGQPRRKSGYSAGGRVYARRPRDKLSDGGKVEQCGLLKDRYGVSWQIVPAVLPKLLGDPDPANAQRVMQAMLGMVKLDIAGLERAYKGG